MSMEAKKVESLADCLSELHLPTVRGEHEAVARQAMSETWGYGEYLLELARRECAQRRQNRIERLLRSSKLPLEKSWSSLELKRLPPKASQQLRGLLSGDFLDRRQNVLVFGPPGSGKTHALAAVSQELVRAGRRLLFTTTSLLVQELLAAKRDLALKGLLKRLSWWEGMVLDDLGYVQQSREEMEVLFTLLSERYERGSVLLTSNLPFSKWEQIFKDPMTAAAAVDRLVHHSVIVELNVPSYRAEAARRSKQAEAREPATRGET
jgi:DNA replication protein DnaC